MSVTALAHSTRHGRAAAYIAASLILAINHSGRYMLVSTAIISFLLFNCGTNRSRCNERDVVAAEAAAVEHMISAVHEKGDRVVPTFLAGPSGADPSPELLRQVRALNVRPVSRATFIQEDASS